MSSDLSANSTQPAPPPPDSAPESLMASKQTPSDGITETTFEPDWDALWSNIHATEAKTHARALIDRLRKEPVRTFHCDMQSTLPMKLKFLEDSALYPKFLPTDEKKQFPLHKVYGGEQAYRGSDKPSFKTSKGTKLNIAKKMPALLVFKDPEADGSLVAFGNPHHEMQEASPQHIAVPLSKVENDEEHPIPSEMRTAVEGEQIRLVDAEVASRNKVRLDEEATVVDGVSECAAEGNKGTSCNEEIDPKWLKVSLMPHSQRPFISLSFPLDPASSERKVALDIYAEHLSYTKDSVGIDMSTSDSALVLQDLPTGEGLEQLDRNLAALAIDHSLWRMDIHLANADAYKVTGLTTEEEAAIQQKNPSQLADGERLVLAISKAEKFTIFTELPASEHSAMTPFFEYFRTVMYAAAQLGNFWWYALVTSGQRDALRKSDFPYDQVPIPQWMITRWRVEYLGNEYGATPQSAQVQRCARYSPVADDDMTEILTSITDVDVLEAVQTGPVPQPNLETQQALDSQLALAKGHPVLPPKNESLSGAVSGKKANATKVAGVEDFTRLAKANSQLIDKYLRNDFIGDPNPNRNEPKPDEGKPRQSGSRGKPPGTGKRSQGRSGVMTKSKRGGRGEQGSDDGEREPQSPRQSAGPGNPPGTGKWSQGIRGGSGAGAGRGRGRGSGIRGISSRPRD